MVISNLILLTVVITALCPPWPASGGGILQISELLQPRASPSWLPDTSANARAHVVFLPLSAALLLYSPPHPIISNNYNNSFQIYKVLLCASLNFIFMTTICGTMLSKSVSGIVAHICNASSWEVKGTVSWRLAQAT